MIFWTPITALIPILALVIPDAELKVLITQLSSFFNFRRLSLRRFEKSTYKRIALSIL